jgi:molybdate transport system substrate-binding protein
MRKCRRAGGKGPVRSLLLLLTLIFLTACGSPGEPQARPLTVAAASDLQVAFTELGKAYESRTGRKVLFTFGSSGTLATQIEQGAPYDLYAAANVDYVDKLIQKGRLIPETRKIYGTGRLVLAVSAGAAPERAGKLLGGPSSPPADAKVLAGLLDPSIRKVAIANPDHAPYGAAAREALKRAGLWERIQPKLVLGENIRQTFQYVETGNVDVALVSLSLANAGKVGYRLVDAGLHPPIHQALAVAKGSPNEQAARELAAFITGAEGRALLKRYGFDVLEEK